jgi:hypothetical protein
MTMTQEQRQVFEQAVYRGIVKNARQAYEDGCAALRRQLLELREEEAAKAEAAAQAEAEMIERNQLRLF